MELPKEVEAFYVIPTVRRELARALVKLGLTQRALAKKIGVTEAAVSQYLSNKRGTSVELPLVLQRAVDAAAKRIRDSDDTALVRHEIDALCDHLKRERVICSIHRKHTTVEDGCSTCFD